MQRNAKAKDGPSGRFYCKRMTRDFSAKRDDTGANLTRVRSSAYVPRMPRSRPGERRVQESIERIRKMGEDYEKLNSQESTEPPLIRAPRFKLTAASGATIRGITVTPSAFGRR